MALSNLKTKYMTRNDCYTAGRKITPKGIMVHSTATPGVMAADWFSRWNKSYRAGEINRQVCVHAFVDDKEVYQYLPWDHRGWHGGGKANDTHIGFEICEPGGFSYSGGAMADYDVKKNEPYFRAAWKNAVELCVLLCKEYGLTEKDIICHSEGYKKGVSSNHSDVMHWFPKHGESMDTFRASVKSALNKTTNTVNISIGDVVEVKLSAERYYPGGPIIPSFVKGSYHKVTQDTSGGKLVFKGGKKCVLLGKKVEMKTKEESNGIMTWIDKDGLNVITSVTKEEPTAVNVKYYRVQIGAFSNKENAEELLKKLKVAGFDGIIKYE